jgi:hypothetical protein
VGYGLTSPTRCVNGKADWYESYTVGIAQAVGSNSRIASRMRGMRVPTPEWQEERAFEPNSRPRPSFRASTSYRTTSLPGLPHQVEGGFSHGRTDRPSYLAGSALARHKPAADRNCGSPRLTRGKRRSCEKVASISYVDMDTDNCEVRFEGCVVSHPPISTNCAQVWSAPSLGSRADGLELGGTECCRWVAAALLSEPVVIEAPHECARTLVAYRLECDQHVAGTSGPRRPHQPGDTLAVFNLTLGRLAG